MEILIVVLFALGIIIFRVLCFFYPDWKFFKGENLSNKQKIAIELISIGILLTLAITARLL